MSDSPGHEPRRCKILIVDDERDIVEYLSMVLEDEGYIASGLTQTAGALEKIREQNPDLVLLDVMMPGHTGLSLYRAMRGSPATKDIPVVIISGYARKEEFAMMDISELESGTLPRPEGYLEKPIAVATLLTNVRRLLGRHETASGTL